MEIMVPQVILLIASEGGREKCPLVRYIGEFPDESVINCHSLPHPLKALGEEAVKIPVDQIVFVQKVPVKRLSRRPAHLADLLDRDILNRRRSDAVSHGDSKPELHGLIRVSSH